MINWVKTKDKLPEQGRQVLLRSIDLPSIQVGYISEEKEWPWYCLNGFEIEKWSMNTFHEWYYVDAFMDWDND